MKKMSVVLCLGLVAAQFAVAQESADLAAARAEAKQIRKELIQESRINRAAQKAEENGNAASGSLNQVQAAAVTNAEVGESDSFNKNAKFFGIAQAGFVIVATSCNPVDVGPLGPDDRCLLVSDPTVSTVGVFDNIGRITIPAKQADNIIYALANHTTNFLAIHSAVGPNSGAFSYTPSVTIESVAFNDPAAVDPETGNPLNGSLTTSGLGSRSGQFPLQPGEVMIDNLSYTRANTLGFSRAFFAANGLPQHVINEIYKNPITIKLNVRVSVRRIDQATIIFGMRFLAN